MPDLFKVHDAKLNIDNQLPVARPGLFFTILSLALFFLALLLEWECLAGLLFFVSAFVIWFFRDPERPLPPPGCGLSPADGRVIKIVDLAHNPYTQAPARQVSIFMNVFNVHVNRAPVDGRLAEQQYHPGAFVNASLDKASEHNERNALILDTAEGPVAVVQIAGLIARRIVCWVHNGDELKRGQRFGMIRFGSRVDLYLPPDSEIMVAIGQKVSAGWSPIWRLKNSLSELSDEPLPLGEDL